MEKDIRVILENDCDAGNFFYVLSMLQKGSKLNLYYGNVLIK